MRTLFKVAMAIPLLFVAACGEKPVDMGASTPGPDSFVYDLTFTPESEAVMKKGFAIGTHATYFGTPKPEWAAQAEAGRYSLDFEQANFDGSARRVRVNGPRLDADKLSRITGDVQVLINVRAIDARGFMERTIHCKAKVVPLKTAKVTPPVVECGMATP